MAKKVTDADIQVIQYLKKAGKSNKEICEITGWSEHTVSRVTTGTHEQFKNHLRDLRREYRARDKAAATQAPDATVTEETVYEAQITIDYRMLVSAIVDALREYYRK